MKDCFQEEVLYNATDKKRKLEFPERIVLMYERLQSVPETTSGLIVVETKVKW